MKKIIYEIRGTGPFFVGHEDENGVWWNADTDGFTIISEAENFLRICQEDQP